MGGRAKHNNPDNNLSEMAEPAGLRSILNAAALSSFFIWVSTYNIACLLFPGKSNEWNCRVVSFLHAIVSSALSLYFGLFRNPWVFTDPGGKNNVYENIVIITCLGYFLFDVMWCLWYFTGTSEESFMLLHHGIALISLLYSFIMQCSGTEMGTVIFGSEISNPMLQLRWFLRESDRKNTLLYEINDFLFIMAFFICRICIGSYLSYCFFPHPRPGILVKVGGMAMYLVGWLFMVQIFNFAFYKYTGMYQKWKESNQKHLSNGFSKEITENGKHD